MLLLLSADFFFMINILKKIFQEHYQSVKLFGSRSGFTDDLSVLIWVQTVFAKVISRQQKSLLARERLSRSVG